MGRRRKFDKHHLAFVLSLGDSPKPAVVEAFSKEYNGLRISEATIKRIRAENSVAEDQDGREPSVSCPTQDRDHRTQTPELSSNDTQQITQVLGTPAPLDQHETLPTDEGFLLPGDTLLIGDIIYSILRLFVPDDVLVLNSPVLGLDFHDSVGIAAHYRLVLAPLNINDEHWALAAINRADNGQASFRVYNPIKNSWKSEILAMMQHFRNRVTGVGLELSEGMAGVDGEMDFVRTEDCAQKTDGSNCAIYTIVTGLCLILNIPVVKHIDPSWWRDALWELWNGKLSVRRRGLRRGLPRGLTC